MPYRTADGTPTDQFGVQFASGAVGARFDLLGRERQGTQPSPTAYVIGAGAGTGASVTSHTGTDNIGNIVLTTGTGTAAGTLVTVTFAVPYTGTNPPIVQVEPKDTGASGLIYATCTNTTMTIKAAGAVPVSQQCAFDYVVICGA
jgi:hypothetical protein